jgi:hypothetical protein
MVVSGDSDLLVHHGMRLLRVGGTGKDGKTRTAARAAFGGAALSWTSPPLQRLRKALNCQASCSKQPKVLQRALC